MRNKGIFKYNTPKTMRDRGQKDGTHDQRTRASVQAGPEASKDYTHTQVDTMNTAKQSRRNLHNLHPHFKNILVFWPFRSPKLRGVDKNNQINVYFCPFLPCLAENPLRWCDWELLEMPELMNAGLLYKAGYYLESIQKGTPPPIWEVPSAFYPHNFSHQKYRKKSPWQD